MAKGAVRNSSFDTGGEQSADRFHSGAVVSIGSQQYATNLWWESVSKGSDAASQARTVAGRLGVNYNLFCVRPNLGQFAIGQKASGQSRNMVSLAGALAQAKGGTWIGLFAVSGGYYVIVVRDGDIYPETDTFLADHDAAREHFFKFYAENDWQEVFAPEELDLEGASPVSIEQILGKPKAPRLQETDLVGGWLKWGVLGLVLTGLVGGGAYYFKQQEDFQAQQALDEFTKNFQQTLSPQQEVVIPPMPWEGKPVAAEYLEACVVGLKRAIFTVPGWTTVGLTCDAGNVRMALDRDAPLGKGGGTINWVRYALDNNNLKDASATPVGDDRVEVVWPLGQIRVLPVEIETYTIGESRRYLHSWFEESFTPIQFTGGEQNTYVANLRFKFESDFEPTNFNSILGKIPGLIINSVIFDLANYKFIVEGSLFEKLALPPEIVNAQIR